ncbi:MAG: hypothetical protein ABIO02_04765 [Patescibacteria group bacterium]
MERISLKNYHNFVVDTRVAGRISNEGRHNRLTTAWSYHTPAELSYFREQMLSTDNPEEPINKELEDEIAELRIHPEVLNFVDPTGKGPEVRLGFIKAASQIVNLDRETYPDFPRRKRRKDSQNSNPLISLFEMDFTAHPEDTSVIDGSKDVIASYKLFFLVDPAIPTEVEASTAINTFIQLANSYLMEAKQSLIIYSPLQEEKMDH